MLDVHRLGMADDGQVEVLVLEHLLQPLRPFHIDDLGLDPDRAQLRGHDLAAAPGIGGRRQRQRGLEAVVSPASASSAFDFSGS